MTMAGVEGSDPPEREELPSEDTGTASSPPSPSPPQSCEEKNEIGAVESEESISTSPPTAFTMIRASELFPLPRCNVEMDHLILPFTKVPGEGVRHYGLTKDCSKIILTNYRLNVTSGSEPPSANIPIGSIESVELRDLFFIQIACKTGQCVRVAFKDNTEAEEWYRYLMAAIEPPDRLEEVFALAHCAWAKEEGFEEFDPSRSQTQPLSDRAIFLAEIRRLRFDTDAAWRISKVNQDLRLCSTYPEEVLVPNSITDTELEAVSHFRTARRFPSIVWRDVKTGAVLVRCSQPEVGWLGWRSPEDEKMIQSIAETCSCDAGDLSSNEGSIADESLNGNAESASIKDLSREASKIGEIKKVIMNRMITSLSLQLANTCYCC